MRAAGSTFLRFGATAVAGLIVDLALASALAALGLVLPLAAAGGFAAGAVLNYVLHEVWTFRDERDGRLSGRRAGFYLAVLGVVLAIRVSAVAAFERMLPGLPDLGVLIAGVAISFGANWFLSRHVVFRPAVAKDIDA